MIIFTTLSVLYHLRFESLAESNKSLLTPPILSSHTLKISLFSSLHGANLTMYIFPIPDSTPSLIWLWIIDAGLRWWVCNFIYICMYIHTYVRERFVTKKGSKCREKEKV